MKLIIQSVYLYQVFIVPIRNWNSVIFTGLLVPINSFYSTYKELKLFYFFNKFIYIILGFYSTYKELKQNQPPKKRSKKESFYSTYKELKLGWRLPIIFFYYSFYSTYKELKLHNLFTLSTSYQQVFIVPIRNWNRL